MNVLTIYNPDGSKLLDACLDSSTQDWAIMSENRLQMEFYSEECVLLPSGCYVDFDDRRFWLLDEYKPTLESSLEYAYNVKFVGAESLLSVTLMLKTTDGENNPIFPLTAPAAQHLALIVANLQRRFPDIPWHVGDVIETENIYIEYAGTYCADAIQQIVSGRDAEWWVDDEYGINIGRCELGDLVELGYQKGLIGGVTHSLANNLRSYAYLCPIGSTRNINPETYGHDRLQLPDGIKLIPMNPEQGVAELAEANAFAGIYPRYIGEVTAVRTEEGTNEDGSKFTIYFIEDAEIPFNPNEYELPGKVKNITFQSGELMGAEFEVNYDEIAHEFEIITQWPNGGAQLPGGFLIPAVGDKYVVWNISMPDEYYPLAEEEFLTAARKFAQDSVKDASVYRAPVDYIDVQERGLTLRPGQRVRLLSAEYFPSTGYYDSRITRIVRDIRYPNELTVEISTVRAEGTIARLQSAIQQTENQLKQVEQSVGEMPTIITSTSVVQPTDSNVYSALRSNKEFLSKEKGGTVKKKVNFVESIQLFGRDIVSYNAEKDVWIWHGNLIVEKGLATYSTLEKDDLLSVFDGLPIDNNTLQWQETENGKILVAVGGGSGGGLDESKLQDYLDEKKYVTESWVTGKNYALKSELDTVSTKLNNFLEGSDTDAIINKWSELEVFLSGLTETENLATILATKFNTADFTKANIKDKLGIADWALSTTNPSYTKAEADNKYLLKTGTAADSSKLGGVAATYFARWADHVVASSSYKHLGYGYSSDGWYTTGPATVFGVSNYKAALQFRWTDSHFYAGYGYETDELSNWKKLAYITDTVDAAKKLLSNSKSVYYDSAKDVWVIEGNLIVTGGFATYTKLSGFTNLDVMGGIVVDNTTIAIVDGALKYIGETSGGLDESALADYLTTNKYATQDWVEEQGFLTEHQSLEGYATQKWVEDKKYLTKVAWADISDRPTKLSQFTNDSKFVTPTGAVAAIRDPEYNTYATRRTTANVNFGADAGLHYFLATSAITDESAKEGHILHFEWDNQVGRYLAQLSIPHWGEYSGIRRRYTGSTANSWSEWIDILDTATYTKWAMSLTTAQEVSAVHDFTNGIKLFGKSPFSYNATKDTWELNGNLVITKGLATYTKLSGFEDLGIMAAIEVDGTTISKDGGVLHFVGNASSGVDEGAVNTLISKALVGYATESWVTGKGYALQSSLTAVDTRLKTVETFFATDDTDSYVNKWDEIVTFLNAVEGDTLDSILSTKFDKVNFTKSNIKSTLGISDWALAASKPSYAFSEIASKPTTLSGYGITNAYTKTEVQDNYLALTGGELSGNIIVKRSSAMIAANNNKDYIGLHNESNCGLWYAQGTTTNGSKWLLGFNVTRSAGWLTVPLAIGTTGAREDYMLYVNGSSRFAGSLTPNAHLSYNIGSSSQAFLRTYTQYLDSPTSYNLRLCSAGTEVITITTVGKVRIGAPSGTSRAKFDVTGDIYTSEGLNVNGAKLTYNSSKNAWQLEGNLIVTGGLATYSTLTGVDLEEYLTTAGGTVSGAILPNSSNTIDLGAVGNEWQTVYARSIQAKAGWGIRFYTGASGATPTSKMTIGTSGRVAIGTESASELLHVAGNIYVTGTVTENSARKLKNVEYEGEGLELDVLKKVKVAKWHWKDKRDDKLHIGAIADDLINIIPEVVVRSVGDDGVETTGIAYGKAGFSIAASLIAPVARHEDRIKELEKDIEKMQKELNQLRKTA